MNVSIWRGIALWLATTVAATAVGWWALGVPAAAPGSPGGSFTGLVVRGAALLLVGCAAWAWLVTTTVLVAAAIGAPRAPGVPAWARRAVLAACGVALVGGSPALAAPVAVPPVPVDPTGGALVGLQLPDRTTGPAHDASGAPGTVWSADRAGRAVVVRPGDSLWRIAASLLPAHAGATDVAAVTDRLYALNRSAIGDDPDLITPGLVLRTPPGLRADR